MTGATSRPWFLPILEAAKLLEAELPVALEVVAQPKRVFAPGAQGEMS